MLRLQTKKILFFLFVWVFLFFSSPLSFQHSNYLANEDILSGKESEFIDRNLFFFLVKQMENLDTMGKC